MGQGMEVLYGDIHNHNALGYGIGSLERAIDVARTHLDFFAFTGHAAWHDMVPMEGGREKHWLDGFKRLAEGWPKVQQLIEAANRDPDFTAFLGYEWHSSRYGDQCVILPDDHRPLFLPDTVAELRRYCMAERGLMIPHHLAYATGHRGVNWDVFAEDCTPVVEIFSEHGCSEHDRAPYDFFTHSMGGRDSANTVKAALARGMKFGFVASTDSHSGFPGAFDEGLLAVYTTGRDRAAIMEGINARRTVALTGDRIAAFFSVDGAPMGADIRTGTTAEVSYEIDARDEIDMVELVQDGVTVHRDFVRPDVSLETATAAPFQLRLEWGWGPWTDLALARVCDWTFTVTVEGGRLERVVPCLRSGPFDEDRRHRFTRRGDNAVEVVSYTSRQGAYRLNPNHSVVLEVSGDADTVVKVDLAAPATMSATSRVADLFAGSQNVFTGPFPKESYQWHRLLPRAATALSGRATLAVPQDRPSSVYMRVRQTNGQAAWASPVFMNHP